MHRRRSELLPNDELAESVRGARQFSELRDKLGILAAERGRTWSPEETEEATQNFLRFMKLLLEITHEQRQAGHHGENALLPFPG